MTIAPVPASWQVDAVALHGLIEPMLHLHRMQCEMAAAWVAAAVGMQRELCDEWICRWGGGVPLDG